MQNSFISKSNNSFSSGLGFGNSSALLQSPNLGTFKNDNSIFDDPYVHLAVARNMFGNISNATTNRNFLPQNIMGNALGIDPKGNNNPNLNPSDRSCFPCDAVGCCGNSGTGCYKGCCLVVDPACAAHDIWCNSIDCADWTCGSCGFKHWL